MRKAAERLRQEEVRRKNLAERPAEAKSKPVAAPGAKPKASTPAPKKAAPKKAAPKKAKAASKGLFGTKKAAPKEE